MLLMDAVVGYLGDIDAWPLTVISSLFSFEPSMPWSGQRIESVAAFFYGNGVPLHVACQFFDACISHPVGQASASELFVIMYDEWSSGSGRKMYYNTKECRYKYTDGSYTSVTLPPTTGIEYTCFPGRIRDVLQKVSLLQVKEAEEEEEEEGDDVPHVSQVAPDT